MSMPWNAKRELQLTKLMLERENVSNSVALKGAVELRQCPTFADRYQLIATCKIGRNMSFKLTEFISKNNSSTGDLVETVASLAESMAELEQRQSDIVNDVKALRKRLSRVLATLRRKGVWIEGSIELDLDESVSVNAWLPALRTTFIGEDLRPETFEIEVEGYDQIDQMMEIAEHVMPWQLKRETLRKIGAVGEVHPLLLFALEKFGMPVQEALASIYANPDRIQDIYGGNGHLIVTWRNGTLSGSFEIAKGIDFQIDRLCLTDALLKTLKIKSGQKLCELIGLGGYGGELIVGAIDKNGLGGSIVHLDHAARPFSEDGRLLI